MNSKKWIRVWATVIITIVIIIGGLNYIVDPLWTFSHSNPLNSLQKEFNERQQKSNYIYFRGMDKYDGLLFGSSRTTFINQNEFNHMNIYNYDLNDMWPNEYKGYIDFAKKVKGREFKYIIIGSDFYGTKIPGKREHEKPGFYIKNTQSFLYRYKMLLSIDNFINSIKNIYNSFEHKFVYDRNNIKYLARVSEKESMERYTNNLKRHTDNLSGEKYIPNNNYINILKEIKNDNPNTKFIIFTSPVTADLLVSIIRNGKRMDDYERWLREIIEVFGEVHHFMTINSITINLQNYLDDDHYYPNIAKLVANKISNKNNPDIPKDFGILLTKENIDDYIIEFKEEINDVNCSD